MLSATAKAKLNLTLHITGKREDGYHLLDSLVCFTQLGDDISVVPADALSLRLEGEFADGISAGDDNLVMRAAKALRDHARVATGATITLHKRLPISAGLGGGSSDAATTLILLRSLWGLAINHEALTHIAAPLGADMSVCLYGKPAFMSGIGDIIEPAPALPTLPVLLVNPCIELSTSQVYKRYRSDGRTAPPRSDLNVTDTASICATLAKTRNDLQHPAITLCAQVAEVLMALETQFDCKLARLCGSGATCFGVFGDVQSCEHAAEMIRRDHPEWWIAPTLVA